MTEIIMGSDHAGYLAKELIKEHLQQRGFKVRDVGCYSEESVHYPLFAQRVAAAVSQGEYPLGVLVCGTGIGMSIAANRYPGVRAAVCHNEFTAIACKEHNNANILCLGARVLPQEEMPHLVDLWLDTEFGGGRHAQRVAMFDSLAEPIKL